MTTSETSSVSNFSMPPISLPNGYLVRDFGYQSTSARYYGDHTRENNPDHDIDYDTPEFREIAMENARKSHAIYMGDMPAKKEVKREGWMRFVPRREMLPRKGKWTLWRRDGL